MTKRAKLKVIVAGSYSLNTKSLQSQYTTRHFIFTHINTGWKRVDEEISGITHPIKQAFIGDGKAWTIFLTRRRIEISNIFLY